MLNANNRGGIRFFVEMNGKEEISYHFDTISEALEMLEFIKDFFPTGRFVIQPALN